MSRFSIHNFQFTMVNYITIRWVKTFNLEIDLFCLNSECVSWCICVLSGAQFIFYRNFELLAAFLSYNYLFLFWSNSHLGA